MTITVLLQDPLPDRFFFKGSFDYTKRRIYPFYVAYFYLQGCYVLSTLMHLTLKPLIFNQCQKRVNLTSR